MYFALLILAISASCLAFSSAYSGQVPWQVGVRFGGLQPLQHLIAIFNPPSADFFPVQAAFSGAVDLPAICCGKFSPTYRADHSPNPPGFFLLAFHFLFCFLHFLCELHRACRSGFARSFMLCKYEIATPPISHSPLIDALVAVLIAYISHLPDRRPFLRYHGSKSAHRI